jgi:hypothetical protein
VYYCAYSCLVFLQSALPSNSSAVSFTAGFAHVVRLTFPADYNLDST